MSSRSRSCSASDIVEVISSGSFSSGMAVEVKDLIKWDGVLPAWTCEVVLDLI